ncbi:aminotransferase class IV [Microbulbifer sp. 2201CG32-9]|uniref:aminotransferase class IV n=1 Tax=Microbulbifer sp. 2201CG32-9 TaxID=3232309 RepID=UPI00345BC384
MTPLPLYFQNGAAVAELPPDHSISNGLLETMRCQGGNLPLWPLHLARLQRCSALPVDQLQSLEQGVRTAVAELEGRVLKLRLRYGRMGGDRYWDLTVSELDSGPLSAQGATLFLCKTRLLTSRGVNPGCKRLSRKRYNLAAAELPSECGPCEGLLMDDSDQVIETLHGNILLRQGSDWVTPDLTGAGVRGVMRDWLHSGIPLLERPCSLDSVLQAKELAVCNSVRGIVPVVELLGFRRWRPGEATQNLQRLVAEGLW